MSSIIRLSVSQTTIEGKIAAYVAFTRGEYQRRFALPVVTFGWFTTGQEGRLLNLKDTAEKTLKALRQERLGQFVYLGRLEENPAAAPADLADTLFCSEHFIIPFAGDQRFPLLPVEA